MAVDMTIYLEHRAGQLAGVSRLLADAGVNIIGYFGLVVGTQGLMHVLVDDDAAEATARALRNADYEVRDEQEALVLDCEDRPGALAERIQPIADAGVNITASYLATATRVVVVVDDPDAARAAL